MENELQTTLNEIKQDKDTNLLPENLKKGVTCLGIEGTLPSANDIGTNPSIDFNDIDIEIYCKLQEAYDNMEVKKINSQSSILNDVVFIPIKSDGTVIWDTSDMTYMYNMFVNSKKIKGV